MGRINRLFGSIGLAFNILTGSLRLLVKYPKLIAPLFPVFVMLLAVEFGLVFTGGLLGSLVLIFIVAFEMMFSFVITSNLLHQIHSGRDPSLIEAVSSSQTLRLIPKVLVLSAVWYSVILILVALEMAINAFLDQDGGEGFVSAIFGTLADALRMMGFMTIPIMTFEAIGLTGAFKRMREILSDSPITALGGLVLTKTATILIFILLQGIAFLGLDVGVVGFLVVVIVFSLGWVLSMYLEQLFVTGLYLYAAFPESEIVGIILEKQIGNRLPELPSVDVLSRQPLQG